MSRFVKEVLKKCSYNKDKVANYYSVVNNVIIEQSIAVIIQLKEMELKKCVEFDSLLALYRKNLLCEAADLLECSSAIFERDQIIKTIFKDIGIWIQKAT